VPPAAPAGATAPALRAPTAAGARPPGGGLRRGPGRPQRALGVHRAGPDLRVPALPAGAGGPRRRGARQRAPVPTPGPTVGAATDARAGPPGGDHGARWPPPVRRLLPRRHRPRGSQPAGVRARRLPPPARRAELRLLDRGGGARGSPIPPL